jgi:uncharacterized spore protein YtfJ
MGIPESVTKTIEQARDAMTVKRVFGEPYEKDGLTIIPAATVLGGAGGGGGGDAEGAGGGGTGFGNLIVLGTQVVSLAAIAAWRALARARARAARAAS